MIFYGLADCFVNEVIDFYASRQEAEATLAQVIADQPEFERTLAVVSVDFGSTPIGVEVFAGSRL